MGGLKVAVAVNENYVYPLRVMLHSLFTTQKEPVTVFLVHTRIRKKIIRGLCGFCASYGAELKEVRVENDIFEQAPVKLHFTKETYYRLILPWLLPDEDRVLYMDPDIIINGSLDTLWNLEFDGASLAAARDRIIMLLGTETRSLLKTDTVYMNTGVTLMDLRRIREEKSRKDIQSLLIEKGENLSFPDQDIINLLWEGQIKQIDDAYNLNPNILYLKEYLGMPWKTHSWKMIHYMGPDKPWNSGYMGNMYFLWAKSEWHVYPKKRWFIIGGLLLEPYRYLFGLFKFIKQHDWKNHNWKKYFR